MRALLRVLLCFLLIGSSAAFAATDSYQYDPLGRLVQWTDSQGRVTEYRYDAVGNILEPELNNKTCHVRSSSAVSPSSDSQYFRAPFEILVVRVNVEQPISNQSYPKEFLGEI